jgi:nitroimidazol reductase NimA-like FMN-containing flavoprotein (pyridoxamine 5'-phosphate oxidase superfamily)
MRHLDEEEIDATLTEVGLGVLSVVDNDQPYGIPVSFGYADGAVSFMLQFNTDTGSRKLSALSSNPRACLTVYQHDSGPPETWRSVIVTGRLVELSPEDEGDGFFALADNAEFAPEYNVFDSPVSDLDLRFFGLEIDSISGREFCDE